VENEGRLDGGEGRVVGVSIGGGRGGEGIVVSVGSVGCFCKVVSYFSGHERQELEGF
jgi:hypothetical protein